MIGFKHVGTAKPRPDRPNPPTFRFYSCDHEGGRLSHHDLALVENPNLPPPPAEWNMLGMNMAINHVAIMLPSREAWLRQLAFLQSKGVKFDRRVEHGMTHSLYIHDPNGYGIELLYELPREVWEDDIDGALNYSISLPTEGPEALADRDARLACRQIVRIDVREANGGARKRPPSEPTVSDQDRQAPQTGDEAITRRTGSTPNRHGRESSASGTRCSARR